MTITPEEMQKRTRQLALSLRQAKTTILKVGLPKGVSAGYTYPNGASIIQVAAAHEFGTKHIPMRSFLRVPFSINHSQLKKMLATQFKRVIEDGVSINDALSIVGIYATNISKDVFSTNGGGAWPDILDATKNRKGSSAILINSAVLRGSITWIITNEST